MTRVRGWLLLLCVLLLVWQPFSLSLTTAVLVARLFAAALGIAAGLSLLQRKPGAVTIARASLIVSAAVDIFVYATPWFPSNRPPGDAAFILAGSLAYYAAWLAYLARSKRVVAIYEP